jgi:hypothetical protein
MTIQLFAVLVAVLGLLAYLVSNNGKVQAIGLACFTAGLAAGLVASGSGVLRLR